LYLKVSEAKELPKGQNMLRTGLVSEKWEALSNYVVIQMDGKEAGRTDTLAKNVWSSCLLFYCHLPLTPPRGVNSISGIKNFSSTWITPLKS